MHTFLKALRKPVFGILLLAGLFSCEKEMDPNPEMPELVDFSWTDYEGAVYPGTIRFFGTKMHYPNGSKGNGPVSTPANIHYTWDFGDNSPVSVHYGPDHTYAFNGTYNVTVTAREHRDGTAKLPGNPMGYVQSLTKPVEVTKVPAYMKVEEQSGHYALTDSIKVTRSGNNLIIRAIFGTAPNFFPAEVIIPADAATGSVYYTGANYPESNQSSSVLYKDYRADATSCPQTNARIEIKNRTANYLGGTFSGQLKTGMCNIGSSYIKYANFSVYF